MTSVETAEAPRGWGQGENPGLGLGTRTLARLALRWSRYVAWEDLDAVKTRSWRLFARTEVYDAWLIAWPTGGAIQLHDHGESSGAIVVVSGVLEETRIQTNAAGLHEPTRRALVADGVPTSFSSHHVHDVTNTGPATALSLHVYSPRLTTMTFYDLLGDTLIVHHRDEVAGDEPEARPSAARYEPRSSPSWS